MFTAVPTSPCPRRAAEVDFKARRGLIALAPGIVTPGGCAPTKIRLLLLIPLTAGECMVPARCGVRHRLAAGCYVDVSRAGCQFLGAVDDTAETAPVLRSLFAALVLPKKAKDEPARFRTGPTRGATVSRHSQAEFEDGPEGTPCRWPTGPARTVTGPPSAPAVTPLQPRRTGAWRGDRRTFEEAGTWISTPGFGAIAGPGTERR